MFQFQRIFAGIMVLSGVALSLLFFYTLKLHWDSVQMLDKAYLYVYQGQWTHHGNAGTGVGFLPGTFLTAVTALPMKIYFSPYSAMAVILLFHLAALYLMIDLAPQAKTSLLGLDLILLFWMNPWRVEQSELYNPAYLIFFGCLHLWSAMKMKNESFWLTFFHVVSIGFALQVHYSFLVLFIASIFFWIFGVVRVSRWGFVAGFVFVLASLFPYAYELLFHPPSSEMIPEARDGYIGRNLLQVFPLLKAIAYWVRYGSTYFGGHIFGKVGFDWLGEGMLAKGVGWTFHVLKWPIALVSVFVSARLQWRTLKEVWKQKPLQFHSSRRADASFESRLKYIGFYLFVGMLVSAALSPAEFRHWHLILCFPWVVFYTTLKFNEALVKTERATLVRAFIFVYFLIHGFFAGMKSWSHDIQKPYLPEAIKYLKVTHPE